MSLRQGDLVTRKSYGNDLLFRVLVLESDRAILCGVDYRLLADAPVDDLIPYEEQSSRGERASASEKITQTTAKIRQSQQQLRERLHHEITKKLNGSQPFFEVPGTVLHLDGDRHYLDKSMQLYKELHVPAEGFHVQESRMPEAIYQLLPTVRPDVVVITGHDGLLKKHGDGNKLRLENYKHSRYFVQAVQIARSYERDRDALTVIAGACQSHFEALLQAGANFASSPSRVLIHALDPVYIAITASYTPIRETLNIYDVVGHTFSGLQGLGGIETRGSYRVGLPRVSSAQ